MLSTQKWVLFIMLKIRRFGIVGGKEQDRIEDRTSLKNVLEGRKRL